MDLSKLKIVHDLHNYEQLTAVLKSKPDYRNILINEINVDFLYSIALWEYKVSVIFNYLPIQYLHINFE